MKNPTKKLLLFIFFGIIVGAVLAACVFLVFALIVFALQDVLLKALLTETIFIWACFAAYTAWFFYTSYVYRRVYSK